MKTSKGAESALEGVTAQQPAAGGAQLFGSTATCPATVTELWEEYQASQVRSILR